MKDWSKSLLVWLFFTLFITQLAAATSDESRTLSPYFFVDSEDPQVDRLPLESTKADVRIAGVIAEVRVTQLYRNRGKRPLEAIYIFPASTQAAVHGMRMTIGERTIEARIRRREEANKEYEQAKREGKSASLLQQERPNVFRMKVANILPGDQVQVELSYSEVIYPRDGVYEFVYPTVVGPRYSNQLSEGAPERENWVENPYQHQGEPPRYAFGLNVELVSGIPIRGMSSPTHQVDIRYAGPRQAQLGLSASESQGGNRDFVLRYQLEGDQIESGLLLYRGQDENFFLLQVEPPERVVPLDIPPREFIFVMDVSGSMHGFPISVSQQLMKDLLEGLRPQDSFNILFFAGSSGLLSPRSLPATSAHIQDAYEKVSQQAGGGGTELLPALQRALSLQPAEGNPLRSIVVLTDGYVNVEEAVFDLIRDRAEVFTFGIGSTVNHYLIEGMARAGAGEPFVVLDGSQAASKAAQFRESIASPVLSDIELTTQGFEVYDLEPQRIPALRAQRPVTVFGKWRGPASGIIQLSGRSARGDWHRTIAVEKPSEEQFNPALRHLWARRRIDLLSDRNRFWQKEQRMEELTQLGLRYHLLTPFTSFVAVDSRVRSGAEPESVIQPLPMPQGVEDTAVTASYLMVKRSSVAGGVVGGVPGGIPGSVIPSPSPAPPAPAKEKEPLKVGGSVLSSKQLTRVEPVYPELAKRARVAGVVFIRIVVDEKGNVVKWEIVRGHPLLNQAAIDAVRQWKYQPTLLNGKPVPVVATIRVYFRLPEG